MVETAVDIANYKTAISTVKVKNVKVESVKIIKVVDSMLDHLLHHLLHHLLLVSNFLL